jgi:hypothetical protein
MSLKTNFQIMVVGFVLAYCGVMGSLGAVAFGDPGRFAIKFALIPIALIGCALIAVAKFSRLTD